MFKINSYRVKIEMYGLGAIMGCMLVGGSNNPKKHLYVRANCRSGF